MGSTVNKNQYAIEFECVVRFVDSSQASSTKINYLLALLETYIRNGISAGGDCWQLEVVKPARLVETFYKNIEIDDFMTT